MNLCNIGHNHLYELEKVLRLFFPFEKINVLNTAVFEDNTVLAELKDNKVTVSVFINGKKAVFSECLSEKGEKAEEKALASNLYKALEKITGYSSPWGMLTGIRPAKLFLRNAEKYGYDEAKRIFKEEYFASDKKIELSEITGKSEAEIINTSKENSFSFYVSVPFCPSRCSYCSFVSHSVDKSAELIPQYLELLYKEIECTAEISKSLGLELETVYIGGGTPTTLSAEQLDKLMSKINSSFSVSSLKEFTVEAGRPDTVTKEKLIAIKKNGATRISINPQTLNDKVLQAIGRKHTVKEFYDAFSLARECGFDNINTDLIAGLNGDEFESFKQTVDNIIELSPENVTVHSLSMKRSSFITQKGELPDIKENTVAAKMVDYAYCKLTENGIYPYYMYRQSKTVGNLENIGYAKKGKEGLYNVFIMDETHSIFACGASAVTKLKRYNTNEIERIFNYKYPYEYIKDFEEIIARKKRIAEFYLR